jgi:5-dehydro-2-deoxygluconokinase
VNHDYGTDTAPRRFDGELGPSHDLEVREHLKGCAKFTLEYEAAYEALRHCSDRSITFHFPSNVDGYNFFRQGLARRIIPELDSNDEPKLDHDSSTNRLLRSLPRTKGDFTMTRGFDRPLYVLPFDHRSSFETAFFGWKAALTPEQPAQIAEAKQVIYDGFKAAVAAGVPKQNAAILVDEQFGAAILRDAKADGFAIACPVEKSGQDEFDFEYGENFPSHLETFQPTFCKVLVRYNPEGDQTLNRRQTDRLKRLSRYLHSESRSLFMFELLVPAEKVHLEKLKGDKKTYDSEIRPRLMVQAIEELQDAHVEPDLWKVEGLDHREDCERIVAAARYGGRNKVGCIVLDRGEDDKKVRKWLKIAATVPGFVGFAVGGRADFWKPLVRWQAKSATREDAVNEIARRYREFVDMFQQLRRA